MGSGMQRPAPRPGLLDIRPYVPGKSQADGSRVYKLSSNESALGPSPMAVAALKESAAMAHRYPDGSAAGLRQRLAEVHGLDPALLLVGSGSDELLSLMVRCYTMPGDEVLMTRHGFSYYPLAARAEGCTPVMAEERELVADTDALLAAVTPRTRVLFLAHPNNPTGTRMPQAELNRLRAELPPQVMLVVDGAYAEYLETDDYDPGISLVRDAAVSGADNVVMTRTFSKIYGLGGLRVGWMYAPAPVIDIVNRVRGPFNVAAPSLRAAEAALEDVDFVNRNRRHNTEEMDRMTRELAGKGFDVRATEANFILLRMQDDFTAAQFLAFLENRGVLVRGLASSNLPDFLRVSIGDRQANDAFLAGAQRWADGASTAAKA